MEPPPVNRTVVAEIVTPAANETRAVGADPVAETVQPVNVTVNVVHGAETKRLLLAVEPEMDSVLALTEMIAGVATDPPDMLMVDAVAPAAYMNDVE